MCQRCGRWVPARLGEVRIERETCCEEISPGTAEGDHCAGEGRADRPALFQSSMYLTGHTHHEVTSININKRSMVKKADLHLMFKSFKLSFFQRLFSKHPFLKNRQ